MTILFTDYNRMLDSFEAKFDSIALGDPSIRPSKVKFYGIATHYVII